MSESGDYSPGPWKGYDFSSARSSYDAHVGRSYSDAVSAGKNMDEILEKKVSTKSTAPLVIACDVTGSMGDWPATMFSKLPYLENEGKEYMGKDMEICFAAVGDAYSDKYPLQVRPFTKGTDLEKRMKELVIEGGGGGQTSESYDLAALYFANKAEMPNAIKPVLIFIGDEGLYESVDKQQAKDVMGINLEERLPTKDLFEQLKTKYSVYLVRKPYGSNGSDGTNAVDQKIYRQWEGLLGPENISILPEAGRVVDVIFGILAKETNRIDYFRDELKGRQNPGQVKTVLKALETIHAVGGAPDKKKLGAGMSVTRDAKGGKPTKSLA